MKKIGWFESTGNFDHYVLRTSCLTTLNTEIDMTSTLINRRDFMKGSAAAAAFLSVPGIALGQTTKIRHEWQDFKRTPQYTSFLNAMRVLRTNTDSCDPTSLRYWVNVHVNFCPHEAPYFLAWHRGYLYYFERQLQIISGDSELMLPYWDYYSYSRIPSEFTDSASGNPLYVPRPGTNVHNALTLAPFDPSVWNYQRGTTNAFETIMESGPHNPVHNLIGGDMATMQSPRDPIFYLHHGNIDRLCHAWALPDGKGIPSPTSSYWAGSFTYAAGVTLERSRAYYPPWLGYDYANNNKPTALPPQTQAARIIRVQAQMQPVLRRPPVREFPSAPRRAIGKERLALGGVMNMGLTEESVSARVAVRAADATALQRVLSNARGPASQATASGYKSVNLALDGVDTRGAGKNGGYFYNVYINLPPTGESASRVRRHFLGTLGAFEISARAHHGAATIKYPATEVLLTLGDLDPRELIVSLVRVDGENAPKGEVIRVGELRLELSTEEPWDRNPATRSPKDCYC